MRSYWSFFRRNRLSDGLSRAEPLGWGGGVYNIGDLAYFTHRGFPSAQSDITHCNSARGIIDLSVGSRHQSRCSAAAGGVEWGGVYPNRALFLQIGIPCLVISGSENTHFHGDQAYLDAPASEPNRQCCRTLTNSLSISSLAVFF